MIKMKLYYDSISGIVVDARKVVKKNKKKKPWLEDSDFGAIN